MAPHPRVAAHAAAFLAALQLAATLSPAAAAGTASATGHGAAGTTAGNAGSGAAVQAALDAAISKGASSFSLPAGDVTFNGTDFSIVGASHMTIRGTPTTTLYFDTGYGTRVLSCHNVTFAAATIDYWVLPYVQATVSAVSEAAASGGNATYELELAPRSAPPSTIIPKLNLANPGHFWKAPNGDVSKAVVSGTVSTCVVPPAGPFPTGLSPCPSVDFSTESGGKFSMTIPAVAGAAIGDLVTFKAAQGHTYVVGNSSHVRTEGLTIRAAGWMAIYEVDGAGGNVFSDITIAPGAGYLIGSNADGFHSTDVENGPTLINSHLTNIQNDFFSTHSTMHMLSNEKRGKGGYLLIDPREFAFGTLAGGLVDEFYGTASPLQNVKPGVDTLSCYRFNSFERVGSSVIDAVRQITDPKQIRDTIARQPGFNRALDPKMQSWTSVKLWNVTLATSTLCLEQFCCCTIDRFGGAGAQILENHFTNGAALLGRTKSSGAVLRGNTWTDTATHTIEITALQNFMEGPIEIKGVTIAGNTLVRSTDNTTSPVAAGPNTTGVVFSDNKIVPN